MTIGSKPASSTPRFECIVPILRVRDLAKSLDHYVRVLGFQIDWAGADAMASVSRDGRSIMLCQGAQGSAGTWLWLGVGNTDALFREYREAGAAIRLPPTNYPWAYEMHVQDPDGHVLRLGSEPLADRPFSNWVSWDEDSDSDVESGAETS